MPKRPDKYRKLEADDAHAEDPNYCLCGETVLYDLSSGPYRVPKPKWHSCAYIHRTNLHLHEAAIEAAHGPVENWQQRFSEAMDRFRMRVMREMEAEDAAQRKLELEMRAEELLNNATNGRTDKKVDVPAEQVGTAAKA